RIRGRGGSRTRIRFWSRRPEHRSPMTRRRPCDSEGRKAPSRPTGGRGLAEIRGRQDERRYLLFSARHRNDKCTAVYTNRVPNDPGRSPCRGHEESRSMFHTASPWGLVVSYLAKLLHW